MSLWEGPIALLDTLTTDRRVIATPKNRAPRHAPFPLPIFLWSANSHAPHGRVVGVEVIGRTLWAWGDADEHLSEVLQTVKVLPCGVDLDDVQTKVVRCLFRRWSKLVIEDWRLRAVTIYFGSGEPAFGGKTFIRLKGAQ